MRNSGKKFAILICSILLLCPINSFGQREMENLNRGVVAVRTSSSQVFVSWRMLGTEYNQNAVYNLYRGSTQIASELSTTNYVDNTTSNGTYSVRAVIGGNEQSVSSATGVWANNYLNVPLSPISNHHVNDCSVGDLDGDGDYEIVIKWAADNGKDNSQSGVTDVVFLEGVELDGTSLWRINLGINIRSGAHYTQFMVYDLDGDGKAEVACKTAPGTRSGTGSFLSNGPAANDNDGADYRNGDGYILSGPEYLTVFDGENGAELSTVNYLPGRGNVCDWGDCYGNRVDRFLACVAYLDGTKPSLVMCRGYYTRSVLAAWDFRNGSLTQRWIFDTNNGYGSFAGQGNHNLSVADVDEDGKDEIIYGQCAIDDNGTGLWTTGNGHGDAMHVSDILPSRPGLEEWAITEWDATPGSVLLDARTGAVIWQTANDDVARGVAADLTSSPGMECWGGTNGLRTSTGGSAGAYPASQNHLIWWDGDEYRELLNGVSITKYGGGTLLTANGCSSNNGSKSNPSLTADIFGDWREEAIWRTTDNTALRIYTTTNTTGRRMYTLMHDPQYRLSIAWQNVAYNQPPHTGFFFGNGMSAPPNPNITLIGGGCDPTAITPYLQINGGSWNESTSADVSEGDEIMFGPQPVSGGSWSWSGPNNFSASSREVTISNIQINQAGNYVATYTNSCGAESNATFNVVVDGESPVSIIVQENGTGFCGVDGSVDSNNPGYTGDGFANTDNASGNGVDFKVNFSTTGNYTFTFRYANGGGSDRPGNLIINGSTAVSSISFPATTDWSSWSTVSVPVNVDAGTYDVRIEATGSSGLGNIDYMEVTGLTPSAASCIAPVTYTLNTSVTGQGSVTPAGGTYEEGSVVSVTAIPASGWQFDNWSGDLSGSANPANINLNSNVSVTANFSEIPPEDNITVRARGEEGSEQIQLVVGGTAIATWTVTTGYQDYSAYGEGDVQVYFINDNGSLDVQIDYVVIDGVTVQSEDQAINTGVWQDNSCGGSYSEWLHCSGYIDYSAPPPTPVTLTIEENETGFCSVDGSIDNNNPGFTGDGFANTDNASGNGITWSVNIPSSGSYDLVWRYANGGSTDRTCQLMVDGSTVVSLISMPSTGSWSSWATTAVTTVNLSAGDRLIRLQATNASGLSNIDNISITGIDPVGVGCAGLRSPKATVFSDNSGLRIAPNPAKGNVIRLTGSMETENEVNVYVYNRLGQLVISCNLGIVNKGNIEWSINSEQLQNGMYFMKVVAGSGIQNIQFIKE